MSVVRGNKQAQLMKVMRKMEATLDKSEKKLKLGSTTLQIYVRGMPTKATNTYKANHQNRDKKDIGSISKDMHGLERYAKYTPIDTTYT